MGVVLRLAVVGIVVLLVIVIARNMRIGPWKKSTSTERFVPFCLKCESNRQVIENSGLDYPLDQFRWFCKRCQEAF